MTAVDVTAEQAEILARLVRLFHGYSDADLLGVFRYARCWRKVASHPDTVRLCEAVDELGALAMSISRSRGSGGR